MTWTCKCGNVNPEIDDKCLKCGAEKAPELTEEERAAWEAHRAANGYAGTDRVCTVDQAGALTLKYALSFYRAARAPLVAELEKERARVKWLEAQLAAAKRGTDVIPGPPEK